jgi:7-cyano-7-deazaguanine reductase
VTRETDNQVNLRNVDATAAGGYTDAHAASGTDAELPSVDVFSNKYQGYEITIVNPEYTSICPKTGLPDFGKITLKYEPDKSCIELKSLKLYFLAYRNLGIFHENAVNRILRDLVEAVDPVRMEVRGDFTPRGGLTTTVTAKYERSEPGLVDGS